MVNALRSALAILLLVVASGASAYPATQGTGWKHSSVTPAACPLPESGFVYGSAVAACQAIGVSQARKAYEGDCSPDPEFPTVFVEVQGSQCRWRATWTLNGAVVQNWSAGTVTEGTGYTCPNGGTLSGNECICPEGQTDTGTSCTQPQCQAAGTPAGTHNYTVGWGLSATPGAGDLVVDTYRELYTAGQSCITGCVVSPKGTGVQQCWRSQAPSEQGLYRVSCDTDSEYTGATCEETPAESLANPTATPASCPTGNVGTVNGKAVCLGTMPAAGINFGKGEVGGNPRAGTKPTDTNQQREPTGGEGGGPDARGGPNVTIRPDGGMGTGSTRTGMPSGGQQGPGGSTGNPTIEIELNTCGTPDTPPCKIDESGTPTGANADAAARDGIENDYVMLDSRLSGVVAAQDAPDRSWGWSLNLPTTCQAWTLPGIFGSVVIDLCQYQDVVHDILSLWWVFGTLASCLWMVFRTVTGGG